MVMNKVVIKNREGLHARLAAVFAETADRFVSNIWLKRGDNTVNAKSIMGVMSLAIPRGEAVEITADGEDEEQAIDELVNLFKDV